jgi:hypothetical protein
MSAADVERLVAAATRAREFTHALAGHQVKQIVLRVPTPHELELATAARAEGDAGAVQFFRALLEQCIVGWSNIVEADLVPGTPDEPAPPLPFDRALVPLLLDAQPAEAVAMRDALLEKLAQRAGRAEAARKN